MRTHAEIIEDAGGWREIRDRLGMASDDNKSKFWFFRDRIPARYWKALVDLKLTSLDELALAEHRKRYLKETGRAA
jgi:hypothetical protein